MMTMFAVGRGAIPIEDINSRIKAYLNKTPQTKREAWELLAEFPIPIWREQLERNLAIETLQLLYADAEKRVPDVLTAYRYAIGTYGKRWAEWRSDVQEGEQEEMEMQHELSKEQKEKQVKIMMAAVIKENIPSIISLNSEIDALNERKKQLQSEIDQINIDLELKSDELMPRQSTVIKTMESVQLKKYIDTDYAVTRNRDPNPTVDVVNLDAIPPRYIVDRPRANKRLIQDDYVQNRTVPPGARVHYGQYLTIIERKTKND